MGKKRIIIRILQHLCAAAAAFLFGIVLLAVQYTMEDSTNYYCWPLEKNVSGYDNSSAFERRLEMDIDNIMRMAVIKSQLETNGTYDGRKKIDIYDYVYRKDENNSETNFSAQYYLEDLIKWNDYGFEQGEVDFFPIQGENEVESAPFYENNEKIIVVEENVDTTVTALEAPSIKIDGAIKERYTTVDGKSIFDFVSTSAEYIDFIEVLQEASSQLSYNYSQYKMFNTLYGTENTNLYYCFKTMTGGEERYFTNDEKVLHMSDGERIEYFSAYGKYIYYYPKHLEYQSNVSIEESHFRQQLGGYEYVFQEDSKVWIAVDMAFPVADAYQTDSLQYQWGHVYLIPILISILLLMLVYFVIFLYGIVTEREMKRVDKVYFEVLIVGTSIIGYAIAWGAYFMFYPGAWSKNSILLLTALTLIGSITGVGMCNTFIRRVRGKVFWKNLLLFRLGKYTILQIIKAVRFICSNRYVVIRTWIPYLAFLIINLLLIGVNIQGFGFALFFDLIVGIVMFLQNKTREQIVRGIESISKGDISYQVSTEKLYGENLLLAQSVNQIGSGIRTAVETSMKDEKLKTDLITNVSHDIKTPLTSIINYVDLIKRENIQDKKIIGYIEILDQKSQRLKQLTEDLVEASKISSGNIEYQFEKIDFVELIHQTIGEFSEKFDKKHLQLVAALPEEPVYILADSRRMWRVIENLYNNIYKYAMPDTRVYMDMAVKTEEGKEGVTFSLKNISEQPLNIKADELTERFIRGDVSRSTEGSGLGLSIAKNLTEAQKGEFTVYLDGDLFKVTIFFGFFHNF